MRISQTANPFEVKFGEKISHGTLAYVRTRVQQWAHALLLKEFKESGITQAELSRRLDKPREVVSRLLARPSNMELDTLSTAIFALRGGLLRLSIAPMKAAAIKQESGDTQLIDLAKAIITSRKPDVKINPTSTVLEVESMPAPQPNIKMELKLVRKAAA